MRRVLLLALLALALPIAASADIIITNQYGSVVITPGGIGVSTITSTGSQLRSYDGITTGSSMGHVDFSTGTLASGSLATGGTFNGGGYFNVVGVGAWTKSLPGAPQGPVTLFAGSFDGPVTLNLISPPGVSLVWDLSGDITGTLYDGRTVHGHTSQTLYSTNSQWTNGIGHIRVGNTNLEVPEPGTLSLLGSGLVGIAGMFRRKLLGA